MKMPSESGIPSPIDGAPPLGAPPLRWLRFILFKMGPSLALLTGLVVVVGRSIGDVTPLLQWISWVPVLMLVPLLLVGWVLSLFARGRGASILRCVCGSSLLLAVLCVCTLDFGFLRSG